MADSPASLSANVPAASKATAQSQSPSLGRAVGGDSTVCAEEGRDFVIGPFVRRAVRGRPYERKGRDPLYRPLRIFSMDPAASKLEGATTLLNVPYEKLHRGPRGAVLAVVDEKGSLRNQPVDLDEDHLLLNHGLAPSPSNPLFHQQMVYAVASSIYTVFRTALGRPVAWGFEPRGDRSAQDGQLILRPHAMEERNSYYDKASGEVQFGYYKADAAVEGRNLPNGYIYTAASHDIIAHEMTHALLDGLRSQFALPTNGDVFAFHEALADLVAFLQRFSYQPVVEAGLKQSSGQIDHAGLLTGLARQFAQTTGLGEYLRRAVDLDPALIRQNRFSEEPHERSTVLVAAVFGAFNAVYRRKVDRYIRLATGGTGMLPPGQLNTDLVQLLAKEASQLASQFLSVCIRAIDYCPPVDIEFGEYLRAIITADRALVPDDPWNYREALIDSFRQHGIFPRDVDSLSDDSLVWREPARAVPPWSQLSFAELHFRGDPGMPADEGELHRQACEIGKLVTYRGRHELFGLADPGAPGWRGQEVDLPCVQSVRSTRRVGPDGQVIFDLVAEVTQRRTAAMPDGTTFDFYGGSTLIIGPEGEVRYAINKRVCHRGREEEQRQYLSGDGKRYWRLAGRQRRSCALAFRELHRERPRPGSAHRNA